MIGGTMGAAVGGTSKFLSNRVAAQYANPRLLTRGQSIVAEHPTLAPIVEPLQAVGRGTSVEVRITAAQADELAKAGLIDATSAKALRAAVEKNGEARVAVWATEELNIAPIEAAAEGNAARVGGAKPKVLELYTGPDLESARHLARQHPESQVVAAEGRYLPSAEQIAQFRAEGGEFLPERFAESLPPGSVEKIYVRYPMPHAKGVENGGPEIMREFNEITAKHPNLSFDEAAARASANVEARVDSMTNFGPHALEKLAPGSTMEVVFWEKSIASELSELTRHKYLDPNTGQMFRLEVTSGPSPVPRSIAPHSGRFGIPPDVTTVTQMVLRKVSAQ